MLGSGSRCSVQGPGARFRARGSVWGPGAPFGAQDSNQGPGAQFRAQVLSLGPEPSPKVGPAKVCLLGTDFQKSLKEEEEKEENLTTLY